MQSLEIVLSAFALMLVGAAALYYQRKGARRFESLIAFCGVALLASGFAMFQDGISGSRKILWMLPHAEPVAAAQSLPVAQIAARAAAAPHALVVAD
ncbi:hypothetical protein [Hyphomicrobium sp. LHD-15]|uniref:hypothetical protein n=1 Tax=Hyphomicrobium sp. LHD-15 TaxID=3072142 RepID=UPI00280CDE0A|nr:hypothetical protein [Hyphomicrobium sp. LHD-15]MDQ8697204.1 hypothetical protein [Hyphomicrobium sp. LHD-15]